MSWIRVPSLRKSSDDGYRPASGVRVEVADGGGGDDGLADLADQLHSLGLKLATMHTIVDTCVKCFMDHDEEPKTFPALPRAVFLIHQWYLPSSVFAEIFVDLYNCHGPDTICGRPDCSHKDRDCTSYSYRSKLSHAIRYWIMLFPMHFDADPALCTVIGLLKSQVTKDGLTSLLCLLETSSVPSYAWMRNISVRNPVAKQISLSFDQWAPEDIANNMTHIEHKILRRISFAEYKQYASSCILSRTPTLERSIAIFNHDFLQVMSQEREQGGEYAWILSGTYFLKLHKASLSQWVQCMVLSKSTPKERAEIMTKFINVAKKLRKLQNFNTLMAVVGGLSHSALARLAKTQAALSAEAKKDMSDMADLLSSAQNFSNYRKALAECKGFRIPIVGVHLKDLIVLHTAMPDYEEGSLVNCRKLAQLSVVFSRLILDLDRSPNLSDANIDLINTLKVSLYIQHSDDEIYDLSVQREPKTLLNSACPKQPNVFAEWASGVCTTPEPDETMRKHVTAMVEAVFKHYDHDKDGYISYAEFESIVGNFPFIDSFAVLDADKDGMISKREMIQYFVKANRQAAASLRKGFRHNFHETTFLAPTTCAHCSKVLWGLLRQGVKCKDCGIPVHRSCKGSVVVECRRKPNLDRSSSFPRPVNQLNGGGPQDSESRLKNRLLLRTKPQRTVSTVSPADSPSQEEDLPTGVSPPTTIPGHGGRLLQAPALASSKKRSLSESQTDYYHRPDTPCTPDAMASLACEEVFEEESSTASDCNANQTSHLAPLNSSAISLDLNNTQPPLPSAPSSRSISPYARKQCCQQTVHLPVNTQAPSQTTTLSVVTNSPR